VKQQVRSRVEHWSAYRSRHEGLLVGAPRTADRPRRWFQRLRNRHGGAAYGPPRGTQAENNGLIHRVPAMYRVGGPIYAHSSITACADAVCDRTLPRHWIWRMPSSRTTASERANRSSLPCASWAGRPVRLAAHQRPRQASVPPRHRRRDRVGPGGRRHALILLHGLRRAGGLAVRAISWPLR
jgi:hypothetical protein